MRRSSKKLNEIKRYLKNAVHPSDYSHISQNLDTLHSMALADGHSFAEEGHPLTELETTAQGGQLWDGTEYVLTAA